MASCRRARLVKASESSDARLPEIDGLGVAGVISARAYSRCDLVSARVLVVPRDP
jgi:hypothetical protein